MKSRKKFTKEFKQTAVRRLNSGQSVAEVARALEVHPSDLHRWRRELQTHGERAFGGAGKKRAEEGRVAIRNIRRDGNHQNNQWGNLVLLHPNCHRQEHYAPEPTPASSRPSRGVGPA